MLITSFHDGFTTRTFKRLESLHHALARILRENSLSESREPAAVTKGVTTMKMSDLKALAAIAGLALSLVPSVAMADVIYNSIPAPLPGNLPSLGYQATQTTEFGDRIQFAGTARHLTTVTVTLSDWAKYSDWSRAIRPPAFPFP